MHFNRQQLKQLVEIRMAFTTTNHVKLKIKNILWDLRIGLVRFQILGFLIHIYMDSLLNFVEGEEDFDTVGDPLRTVFKLTRS